MATYFLVVTPSIFEQNAFWLITQNSPTPLPGVHPKVKVQLLFLETQFPEFLNSSSPLIANWKKKFFFVVLNTCSDAWEEFPLGSEGLFNYLKHRRKTIKIGLVVKDCKAACFSEFISYVTKPL